MHNQKAFDLSLVLYVIIIVAYSFFVFLVPLRTDVLWMSYAFSMIAIIVQIGINVLNNIGKKKYKFLGFPLLYFGWIYMIVQIIVSIGLMVSSCPFRIAMLLQVMIMAIFLIIIILAGKGKEYIVDSDARIEASTEFIYKLSAEAENLYLTQTDTAMKSELKKLYEAIRYSDPISSGNEVLTINEQIYQAFQCVKERALSGQLDNMKPAIKHTMDLIIERNLLCQSIK